MNKTKITDPTWIIHCINPEKGAPCGCRDTHTHGLNAYGHPELMTVLDFEPSVLTGIINEVGFAIVNDGLDLSKDGDYLLENFTEPIRVRNIDFPERISVLFFPDMYGNLPGDKEYRPRLGDQEKSLEYIVNDYKKWMTS